MSSNLVSCCNIIVILCYNKVERLFAILGFLFFHMTNQRCEVYGIDERTGHLPEI